MVAGLPTAEPETDRWAEINENTLISKGSKTAPTKCKRPLGFNVFR